MFVTLRLIKLFIGKSIITAYNKNELRKERNTRSRIPKNSESKRTAPQVCKFQNYRTVYCEIHKVRENMRVQTSDIHHGAYPVSAFYNAAKCYGK